MGFPGVTEVGVILGIGLMLGLGEGIEKKGVRLMGMADRKKTRGKMRGRAGHAR